jgi:hypothetical protein
MAKYDKDQYQNLLRQFDSLKQTTSVLEYQAAFEKLAHGIVLNNPAINDTFFVTRFVSGLREDIRAPLMLHRSSDVDTAKCLGTHLGARSQPNKREDRWEGIHQRLAETCSDT